MTSQQTGGLTPTRRTLVKGAAWSVPVVEMGSAAPAFAASQEVVFNNLGRACKLPGASCQREVGVTKGYVVAMQFCTTVRGTVTIDFGTATGTLCGEPRTWAVGPDPLVMTGSTEGEEVCALVDLGLQGEPDSANCAISGSAPFTWSSDTGLSGTGTLVFSAPSTPPCENCIPPVGGTAATTGSTTDEASTTSGPTG